jgi:hypothetical protein
MHMWDNIDFRVVVATGTRAVTVKRWFKKPRLEELGILFMIDDSNARSYDTEYPWMYKHVTADNEINRELVTWIETGVLPVWSNPLARDKNV